MSVDVTSHGGTLAPPWQRWPWPPAPRAVIPTYLYTSPLVLDRERERIFPQSWNYVALEAEIPAGGFIPAIAGDIPVIVSRDQRGTVACVVNQCGHRGVKLVQDTGGTGGTLRCPYHQWGFGCSGQLISVPFRRGTRGCPGLPDDFDLAERNLRRLKVAVRHGAVFASLNPQESLEDWLGPRMLRWYDHTLDGRELRVLGRHTQRIRGNWKLYCENLRDPYHGGLLHDFFRRFRLASAAQAGGVEVSGNGCHSVLIHYRDDTPVPDTGGLTLHDPRILQLLSEEDGPTTTMQAIGPTLVVGRQLGSRNMRQIVPRGPGEFDLIWTFFGYADDSPEMTAHRIRQASLQGPSGYISIDDATMFAAIQETAEAIAGGTAVIEMGGRGTGDAATVVTETAIRGFYRYYREAMGLQPGAAELAKSKPVHLVAVRLTLRLADRLTTADPAAPSAGIPGRQIGHWALLRRPRRVTDYYPSRGAARG